ncbi:hypothetical protein [Pedobacter cryotolerans]|uniref:Uncharacterized protein n=1 Tax=Pedobacter cryotolerans TaxID=2571270 RepID=A0A4U1BWB1_9SPHI|nr:hypothetical protein [Pedobacter cryotolerans]TKB97158.1 hypothetical protein FA045_17385 [Pedobacter cryotolerans]
MKATIIKSILAAFIIIICVNAKSKAQTYYPVYLCDGGTANLHTPEEVGLTNGDQVYWYLEGVEVDVKTFNGTANTTNITTPNNLGAGVHNYTNRIKSKDGCWGDMSDAFPVYQLPTKTLALTKSIASYCGSDASLNSVITATTTPAQTLPDGIEYAYVWTATKNTAAVPSISTIGTDLASQSAINTFTLNTTDAGIYVFNATVKYVKTTGNTGALKSGDSNGCEVTAATTQTVTVTPKPVRPTIVVQ